MNIKDHHNAVDVASILGDVETTVLAELDRPADLVQVSREAVVSPDSFESSTGRSSGVPQPITTRERSSSRWRT
ncbi:hypothetical protein EKO23_16000 [Nocardioides guangzhouensis]|uniref:Uncharacterized protein n=1 Tax=Nocardioides guangzhouensis TaxID=2497878 RepID=A0A4Q4Z8X7_9ACTN|nr:hypothetical protein [Nocardioides guangzhouensis]RYP84340.1 hypothetical protein EKO23_16000 [Nocardioides guangzhouensis]